MTSMLLLNDTEAYFGQSFIRPEHRGQGLSSLLYKIRMTWVNTQQIKRLIISHREINTISKKRSYAQVSNIVTGNSYIGWTAQLVTHCTTA
ncbi:GNAT family N-acetyltransferase [Sphingobacterium sp. E70]|nr:GNAT family N-acetyltransferase [Sphingobacterium sp. E70]